MSDTLRPPTSLPTARPPLATTRPLLFDAAERAATYLEGLEGRRVAAEPGAVARLPELGGRLPDGPLDAGSVLGLLDEVGSPATFATAGGRFFGFVIGGSLPAALAANWLAGAWDQNAGLWATSATAAYLEEVALAWALDALGLPDGCGGAFVTGSSTAHVTALAAARDALLAREGWDALADGLFGAPPVTVVTSQEAHPTLLKALGVLGLGRARVKFAPADAQGRMRAADLPALSGPTIVCVQAGNVNSGSFDEIEEIVTLAHRAGAWVHVDGAFGLWAAASPALAGLVRGAGGADSWATDFHKWLNVPYDSGLAVVRDPTLLAKAMSLTAAYLPTLDRREPAAFTLELSRRARGVEVWAALRSLGRSGLAELVDRTCRHARRFAQSLAEAGHEVLNDVVLNQVLVAFGDDARTRSVVRDVQNEGVCWCGPTVWRGRTAMRISVSSWATTDQDVELSLESILRAARV